MNRFLGFEVGPIRPPSEAKSLLIRVTRNCQWNRCTFCPVYKGKEFSERTIDDVISDIDLLKVHVTRLRESFKSPSELSRDGIWTVMEDIPSEELPAFDYALKWFSDGMQSVFLQDSDALVIGTDKLERILFHLRKQFPWIERVTSYSRSSTILKIGKDGLSRIRTAGLDRIHIGLESGSDTVLQFVKKGASHDIHVRAGQMVKEIGFELSEYVMPGLGGIEYSEEHAKETARALNQINPDFIRLRPLAITSRAPLSLEVEKGTFEKLNDIQMAEELRLFLQELDGISSMILSDHILNLFADLEGRLPEDKEQMLKIIDSFLDMDKESQMVYRLGRRLGLFDSSQDMKNQEKLNRVKKIASGQGITENNIDSVIDKLMERFI